VLNDSDVPVTAEIQPNDIDGMMSFVRGGGRIHLDDQRHRASVNGRRRTKGQVIYRTLNHPSSS